MKLSASMAFLICVNLSFLISCKHNSTHNSFKVYNEEVTSINHESFCPSFLIYVKDHLLLINNDRDTIFELVDLKTKTVKKFGLRGRGPNEFLYISDAYNDDYKEVVTIVDVNSKNVYSISYDDILNCDLTNAKQLKLPTSITIFTAIRITSNGWVYGDLSGNAMVTQLTNNGALLKFEHQPKLPYSLNQNTKAYAYYSAIAYNSELNKTIVALRYFPYVYILNEDGTLYKTIKTTEKYEVPIFKNNSLLPSESSMIYCWEVHTNEKHIYIGNAGITQGDFEQDNLKGTSILVYDWDGNQVSEIKADFAFVTLAFDFKNKKIYGNSTKDMYHCVSRIPLRAEL
ncbi:MAG: BF3164 family lipoprotein [Bacteroidales bacterium]|nr:BF3164 family lipoprotein [Bacteroidales bacterium]MDD3891701.1 BF3164 family lipoprotein [Bacteroidales bacterium]